MKRETSYRIVSALILFGLLMGMIEGIAQYREDRYVGEVARGIVQSAGAETPREKVLALRDYLRGHVTFFKAPHDDRPFLRASAAETLRSRLGYCGEVTRAFINLAGAVGVQAQRINLWGATPHVVAEADLGGHDLVIVDCQYPPQIEDLEKLDRVILRPEYDDYYTLNLRRLQIAWLVSRVKTEMGPLTYWTENPHALKGLLWSGLAAMLGVLRYGRQGLRALLRRRGWVHVSEVNAKGLQDG